MNDKMIPDNNRLNYHLEALKNLVRLLNLEINSVAEKVDMGNENGFEFTSSFEDLVRNFEIDLIRLALLKTGGRKIKAAKLLRVKKSTFCAKVNRYHISLLDQDVPEDPQKLGK